MQKGWEIKEEKEKRIDKFKERNGKAEKRSGWSKREGKEEQQKEKESEEEGSRRERRREGGEE